MANNDAQKRRQAQEDQYFSDAMAYFDGKRPQPPDELPTPARQAPQRSAFTGGIPDVEEMRQRIEADKIATQQALMKERANEKSMFLNSGGSPDPGSLDRRLDFAGTTPQAFSETKNYWDMAHDTPQPKPTFSTVPSAGTGNAPTKSATPADPLAESREAIIQKYIERERNLNPHFNAARANWEANFYADKKQKRLDTIAAQQAELAGKETGLKQQAYLEFMKNFHTLFGKVTQNGKEEWQLLPGAEQFLNRLSQFGLEPPSQNTPNKDGASEASVASNSDPVAAAKKQEFLLGGAKDRYDWSAYQPGGLIRPQVQQRAASPKQPKTGTITLHDAFKANQQRWLENIMSTPNTPTPPPAQPNYQRSARKATQVTLGYPDSAKNSFYMNRVGGLLPQTRPTGLSNPALPATLTPKTPTGPPAGVGLLPMQQQQQTGVFKKRNSLLG